MISDALSRVTPLSQDLPSPDMDILGMNFLQYSSIKEKARDDVLQETNKDNELQALKNYISTGWPAKKARFQCFYILIGILEMSSQ